MSPVRRSPLAAAAVAVITVALSACGGSGATSSTSHATGGGSTQSSSAAPGTSTSKSATAGSPPASTSTPTQSGSATTSPSTPPTPQLPAQFKINPGGGLSPSRVSAPPHTAVALSLISSGASYVVALQTPHRQSYAVSGDHPVHVLLNGLANGTYTIEVDGHPRGKLIVGVAPGP